MSEPHRVTRRTARLIAGTEVLHADQINAMGFTADTVLHSECDFREASSVPLVQANIGRALRPEPADKDRYTSMSQHEASTVTVGNFLHAPCTLVSRAAVTESYWNGVADEDMPPMGAGADILRRQQRAEVAEDLMQHLNQLPVGDLSFNSLADACMNYTTYGPDQAPTAQITVHDEPHIRGWFRKLTFTNVHPECPMLNFDGGDDCVARTAYNRLNHIGTVRRVNRENAVVDTVVTPLSAFRNAFGCRFLYSITLMDSIIERLMLYGRDFWKAGWSIKYSAIDTHGSTITKTAIGRSKALLRRANNARPTHAQTYKYVKDALVDLLNEMIELDLEHSGFMIQDVLEVGVTLAKVILHRAGSYIPTPMWIFTKRCVANIKNEDEFCAKYCLSLWYEREIVMKATNPKPVMPRDYADPEYHKYMEAFNWDGIEFPMSSHSWDTFERKNPEYGVFLYELDGENVITNRLPSNRKYKHTIPLLILTEDGKPYETCLNWHYVLVTSMTALMYSGKKGLRKRLVCPYCITPLKNDVFSDHVRDCGDVCETRAAFPKKGEKVMFRNFHAKWRVPVTMYGDFESRMERQPDGSIQHIPVSFAISVHNEFEGRTQLKLDTPFVLVTDNDPKELMRKFVNVCRDYSEKIRKYWSFPQNSRLRQGMRDNPRPAHFNMHELCTFCEKPLGEDPYVPTSNEHYSKRKATSIKFRSRDTVDDCEDDDDEEEAAQEEPMEEDVSQLPIFDDGEADSDSDMEEQTTEAEDILAELMAMMEEENLLGNEAEITADTEKGVPKGWTKESMKRPMQCFNHSTGDYYGVTHLFCCTQLSRTLTPKCIPFFWHNGSGYDFRHIIHYLGETDFDFKRVFCISQTSERLKRVDMMGLSFVDSCSHLATSLDTLVKRATNNGKDKDKCVFTKAFLAEKYPSSNINMLIQKGVFPYSWLDSAEKLDVTALPPIEAFHNDLTNESCSVDDYQRAHDVWDNFGCHTMRDYMELYLTTDVLLLQDVMNIYRTFVMKNYRIDPARKASVSALSLDAFLLMTKVEIELVSDPDMFLMFQRCIRGGLSIAVSPYAEADNKDIRLLTKTDETFTEREGDSYIANCDANNLYGAAMTVALPLGNFEWVDVKDFNIELSALNPATGFLLEVDLHIPEEYHDVLNDFPPAVERLIIKREWLSEEQQLRWDVYGSTKIPKLVATLRDKKRYVVHADILVTYLKLGAVVTKLHRAISYTKSEYIKPYVAFNTSLRKMYASIGDVFGTEFCKSMTNHLYGKTVERSERKGTLIVGRGDIDDVEGIKKSDERIRKAIARNNFCGVSFVGANVAIISVTPRYMFLNKPIAVGGYILDKSKDVMYDFWYNHVVPFYGRENAKFLYMDTDSCVFWAKTGDLFEDFKKMDERANGGNPCTQVGQGLFDWSSLNEKAHPQFFSMLNSKELFFFKPDMGSHVIKSFTGLRAKMYKMDLLKRTGDERMATLEEKVAIKGIPRSARGGLDFDKALQGGEVQKTTFTCIKSSKMVLSTETIEKCALSLYNDKRWLVRTGPKEFTNRAIGHYLN